ncbi:tRNA (uracil(54)-C(5))-methyltransferase [Martiniozyma asiatica (nom. inval.)]|nr:tRNA (uracil(54)-C(5))-methyltransferase [Martiniozyma asiatica]
MYQFSKISTFIKTTSNFKLMSTIIESTTKPDWRKPVKRSRASHRKPPKTNYDPTSPIGVLVKHEIPKLLNDRKDYIKSIFELNEYLTMDQIKNPMRDLVNDISIKWCFNNREIKNVEVLALSAKGDGIALIKAPTFEQVIKAQNDQSEKEAKEIAKRELEEAQHLNKTETGTEIEIEIEAKEPVNPKYPPKVDRTKHIHRRKITQDVMPIAQIVIIPFALPGDIVDIKLNLTSEYFVDSEIIKLNSLSMMRYSSSESEISSEQKTNDKNLVIPNCSYFGICSGCQYQNLPYSTQLEQKKNVVIGAYESFGQEIESDWKGKILSTVGSPLQYGYRTKLTPHYDVPRSVSKKDGNVNLDVIPRLGYGIKGKGKWIGVNFERYEPFNDYSQDEKDGFNVKGAKELPRLISQSSESLPKFHEIDENERSIIRNRSLRPYPGDVIDIEDCLIGTDIIRKAFLNERERLSRDWKRNIRSKKGVTILLRENSLRIEDEDTKDRICGSTIPDKIKNEGLDSGEIKEEILKIKQNIDGAGEVLKTCVTDPQTVVSDLVDTGLGRVLRFDFIANEFFQNNNSILPLVIRYVHDELFNDDKNDENKENYLVDAYCGSGLFSVAIASSSGKMSGSVGVGSAKISKVLGVEISERAVEFAKRNAKLNEIPQDKCDFIWGKAEKLFEKIDFPKDHTGVILDPPRKGCDEVFLNQLSDFEPKRIVYVSCNVHSQARDIKFFLKNTANGSKYKIKSIRGFDFFPQTHHVESVAVLVRD